MKTRQLGMLGLAALGLVLCTPVQATPDALDGAFMVAAGGRGDRGRQDARETHREERASERDRRAESREARDQEPRGYGYGYERRRQHRSDQDDGRPRGRR